MQRNLSITDAHHSVRPDISLPDRHQYPRRGAGMQQAGTDFPPHFCGAEKNGVFPEKTRFSTDSLAFGDRLGNPFDPEKQQMLPGEPVELTGQPEPGGLEFGLHLGLGHLV